MGEGGRGRKAEGDGEKGRKGRVCVVALGRWTP